MAHPLHGTPGRGGGTPKQVANPKSYPLSSARSVCPPNERVDQDEKNTEYRKQKPRARERPGDLHDPPSPCDRQ